MKPFKAGEPISNWLIRIGFATYLAWVYAPVFMEPAFGELGFYLRALTAVFALLLLVGGFLSKPDLTVISGLFLTLLLGYFLVVGFTGKFYSSVFLNFILFALGYYFFAKGNKS